MWLAEHQFHDKNLDAQTLVTEVVGGAQFHDKNWTTSADEDRGPECELEVDEALHVGIGQADAAM